MGPSLIKPSLISVDLGVIVTKEYLHYPKLHEPHHQTQIIFILRTLIRGGFTPLLRCSRRIQPDVDRFGAFIYFFFFLFFFFLHWNEQHDIQHDSYALPHLLCNLCIFPSPFTTDKMWNKINFWAEETTLEFRVFPRLVALAKIKNTHSSQLLTLSWRRRRIDGFMPFIKALVSCEM